MLHPMADPIRPTDDDARGLVRSLLGEAQFAALAVLDPETRDPVVTRIALRLLPQGLFTLISDLSSHTVALKANPTASLLVGEPGPKGDPLTHPRLTLRAEAHVVPRSNEGHAQIRQSYLERTPKAGLYVDFGDFHFVRFDPRGAFLNGGFGKAYQLTEGELVAAMAPEPPSD